MLSGAVGYRRKRPSRRLLLACLAALVPLAEAELASAADSVVVDAASDGVGGNCELRDAIASLNIVGVQDGCTETPIAGSLNEITFDIGADGSPQTIAVTGTQITLPNSPTEIDGSNDPVTPGAVPKIEIDAAALASGNGLLLSAGSEGSEVRDLIVNGAPDNGVLIDADSVTLRRLVVGTDLGSASGIGNDKDGIRIRANDTTVTDSLISGNGEDGIDFQGLFDPAHVGTGTTIKGNTIGMNATGTAPLPNVESGIGGALNTGLGPADAVTIGGSDAIGSGCVLTSANDCNLIAGNGGSQIDVSVTGTDPGVRADGWAITGNQIGTNGAGAAAADTTVVGSCNSAPSGIKVGGSFADLEISGNLISGVRGNGIQLAPAPGAGSLTGPERTVIRANRIGTNAAGTAAVPNQCDGIQLSATIMAPFPGDEIFDPVQNTAIGGTANPTPTATCDGDCNLISGNGEDGVLMIGRVVDTSLVGNQVGTNLAGNAAIPNGDHGIDFAPGNFDPGEAGGSVGSAAAPNVISGNTRSGVQVTPAGEAPLTIAANRIGVGANAVTAIGNGGSGVALAATGTTDVTIGGTAFGAGNVIAHNSEDGVQIQGAAPPNGASRNPILRNSIHSNGDLGIDLMHDGLNSGPDPNGACFGDAQANECQPFPVLTAVAGGSVAVRGTLQADPLSDYRIELFANTAADSSGFGEGQRYLGSLDVSTGIGPDASFLFTSLTATLGDGEFVTATATKLGAGGAPGSTSEFSEAVESPDCSLTGGPGANVLTGTVNRDIICGLAGADTLTGGAGPDAIFGGTENDTINADDGIADPLIDCGPGNDTVEADASDVLVACEIVNPEPPPPPPPDDTEPPDLKLSGDKKQDSKKKVVVKAKCKDEACDLDATGTIKISGRKYDLKKKSKDGAAEGEKKTLKLKLRNQAKAKLAKVIKKKKSKAKIKVTATDEAGNTTDKLKFEVKVKKKTK